MKYLSLIIILLIVSVIKIYAERKDSLSHWGLAVAANPGRVIAADKYEKKWLKHTSTATFSLEATQVSLPSDSDAYAQDFGYPTFSIGLRYSCNGKVIMHRDQDPDWGYSEEVNYNSHLGNTATVYGGFSRPFFRSKRWEIDYSLFMGIAYSRLKYNPDYNADDELIGSRWLLYFGAGFHATYRVADDWGIKAGIEYLHQSNGALNRPNKGTNAIGPTLALIYYPYYKSLVDEEKPRNHQPFKKYFYADVDLGFGGKALMEDWLKTQFFTKPGEPDYRTDRFHFYTAYSLKTDVMYRYARKWASGIGFDLFYSPSADHIRDLDEANGFTMSHSRWSMGISGKHEVFYHNLSLAVSIGVYLYRKMGQNAKYNEKPYYEHIGLRYAFPSLHGMKIGLNVKAHRTIADLTEFIVECPLRL
jgi:hypothetical protein